VSNAITCRSTAIAVLTLWVAQADDALFLNVLREYRYSRDNVRGNRARHSVHRLRGHTLVLPLSNPATWGDTWYILFDLANAMASTHPRRLIWVLRTSQSVNEYGIGAMEMLTRSIAVELNFEVSREEITVWGNEKSDAKTNVLFYG